MRCIDLQTGPNFFLYTTVYSVDIDIFGNTTEYSELSPQYRRIVGTQFQYWSIDGQIIVRLFIFLTL
jgi:hypothetical protein